MFYKIKTVKPHVLLVQFENGERKKYDVKPFFGRWEAFRALPAVKGLFEQVRVDTGGYGVSWDEDIGLSCNELYNNGMKAGSSIGA